MIPHERSLVKRMEGRPFALIGINTDSDKTMYFEQAKKMEVTWRSSWQGSGDGPICTQYRVEAYPTLFLLDHQGVIRNVWRGAPVETELDQAVEALVAQAERAGGK